MNEDKEPLVPSPIEEIIADLGNIEKPLLSARLADLSNLNPADLGYFEQVWPTVELKRRQQVVSRLSWSKITLSLTLTASLRIV